MIEGQNSESPQNSIWAWLKKNEKTLTAIGTFVSALGSIAVAWQASAIANQAKITAVLSFQEKRIQEEPLVESFKNINEVILAAKQQLQDIDNEQEYEEVYRRYIIEAIKPGSQGREDDIQLAFSFYKGIANCVNQGACDRAAAVAIFGEDVREFNIIFAPYFCDIAIKTGDYKINKGLETFYGPNQGVFNERTCSTFTALKP